jgi:excisionase family DNA binding protein
MAPDFVEEGATLSLFGEEWITTSEAAEILGTGRNWVAQLIRNGDLPAEQKTVRGQPTWFLKRSDVEAFKEATRDRVKRNRKGGE